MRKRNWTTLLLALVMCMTVLIAPTSAHEEDDSAIPDIFCKSCPNCGRESWIGRTTWSGVWQVVGEQSCTHGFRYGTDSRMIQYGTQIWNCSMCGNAATQTVSKESVACRGHN